MYISLGIYIDILSLTRRYGKHIVDIDYGIILNFYKIKTVLYLSVLVLKG